MWKVFRIKKSEEDLYRKLLKDDRISRLSIAKREAQSLGIAGEDIYIILEGDENLIEEARKILEGKEVGAEEANKIYEIYRKQIEDAQAGMGAIFG